MIAVRNVALAALAAALFTAPALAQQDHAQRAAECAAPAQLPVELASWAAPLPFVAATNGETLSAAALLPGRAVTAKLASTPEIVYPIRPEKPSGSVSHGGLFEFDVPSEGRYRVALGSAAWIDLLDGNQPVASVAHGHGPACSGIRKMVDFALHAGHYRLQVAGNGTPELTLMVTRRP